MSGLLGDKFVNVGCNTFIKGIFVAVQAEGDGFGVPVRKEPPAFRILEILFQSPERPWRILAKVENLFADCGSLFPDAVWFRKQVRVDKPKEMSELVFISVVGGRGQEQYMVRLFRKFTGEKITFGWINFRLPAMASGGCSRRALVSFVNDDKIPFLLPDPFAHVVLFGIVHGRNDLRRTLPGVCQLLLIDSGKNDIKRLAEPTEHLVLPLDCERRGAQDKNTINGLPQFHLFDQEPGHDRFPGSRVIGQKKPQPGLRKHCLIYSFNLMRQGANTRKAYGKLFIVSVGKADSSGLDQEPKLFGINGLLCFCFTRSCSTDSHCLLRGDDRFFQ